MTIVLLRCRLAPTDLSHMADALLLAKLASLAALIGSTIEYAEMIKRRVVRRAATRDRAVLEERSLQGLVRVFLADPSTAEEPLATTR
jgi:hypothetical protein